MRVVAVPLGREGFRMRRSEGYSFNEGASAFDPLAEQAGPAFVGVRATVGILKSGYRWDSSPSEYIEWIEESARGIHKKGAKVNLPRRIWRWILIDLAVQIGLVAVILGLFYSGFGSKYVIGVILLILLWLPFVPNGLALTATYGVRRFLRLRKPSPS